MRKTAITCGLLLLASATSVGCKSTQKLAWWKSSKSEPSALAHTAPELPSEAALKAEGKAQVAQTGKSGSGYPSTDAPPFTPSAVTQAAAGALASATAGAAGPYDPAATPAPKVPPTAVASTGTDRYGFGSTGSAADSTLAASAAPASVQDPGQPSTADLTAVASRYGMPASSATAPAYSPAVVTPASTVAAQSYRPGGTSSYGGAASGDSHVSVASVPYGNTSSTPAAPTTTTESSATPTEAAPPAASGSNRYW